MSLETRITKLMSDGETRTSDEIARELKASGAKVRELLPHMGFETSRAIPTPYRLKKEPKKMNEVEQDEVEQDEVEQDEVEQDEVEQDEVEQDEVEQDEVEQDEVKKPKGRSKNLNPQSKINAKRKALEEAGGSLEYVKSSKEWILGLPDFDPVSLSPQEFSALTKENVVQAAKGEV